MNDVLDDVTYVDAKVMQPGSENNIKQESTGLNIDETLDLCSSFGYYQILVNITIFLVAVCFSSHIFLVYFVTDDLP